MKNKNQIKKEVVYIVLAVSYFVDPRVKQEVKTLTKNGFFTYVLSWDREGKYKDLSKENLYIKSQKLLQARKFNKILFLISAILFQMMIVIHGLKLLRKNNRIILHVNDFNTILGSIVLKFFFKKRIKTIYDCHELTPAVYGEWYGEIFGKIIGKFESIGLRLMDEIITVSPPIQNYFEKISKKQAHLIWNYPSEQLFPKITNIQARKELGIEENCFLLVYTGSLRQDIALVELVHIVHELIKNDKYALEKKLKVIIVGDGPLFDALQDEVKELSLQDSVDLVGRVTRRKTLIYIAAANLSYILFKIQGLNTKIGMPWKLYESMVTGTPVLVNEKTYTAKFVKERKAGYVMGEYSKKKQAQKIAEIISKTNKIAVKKQLDLVWERQEQNFLEIYRKAFTKK